MQTELGHPGSTGTRARSNSVVDKSFHFLCIKVNKWRGRYQRILHLDSASISTLDPAAPSKTTNSWRWSQVTKCVATSDNSEEIIKYSLPLESIENIEIIDKYKNDIFKLPTTEFFREYNMENKVFAIIEKNNNQAKIFLNTEISNKKLKKNIIIKNYF